jgi:hypothetical protein
VRQRARRLRPSHPRPRDDATFADVLDRTSSACGRSGAEGRFERDARLARHGVVAPGVVLVCRPQRPLPNGDAQKSWDTETGTPVLR